MLQKSKSLQSLSSLTSEPKVGYDHGFCTVLCHCWWWLIICEFLSVCKCSREPSLRPPPPSFWEKPKLALRTILHVVMPLQWESWQLPLPSSSACTSHQQWERCNTWSSTAWAPTAAASLRGMPLPQRDGQALLAVEESTTLVNPPSFLFPLPVNPLPSALESTIDSLPPLFVWTISIFSPGKNSITYRTVMNVIVGFLSPNPQRTQPLTCCIHAVMRDKMEIK